jgi:hypothetical protein
LFGWFVSCCSSALGPQPRPALTNAGTASAVGRSDVGRVAALGELG